MPGLVLALVLAAPEVVATDVPGPITGIALEALGRPLVAWAEGEIGRWRVRVAERGPEGAWQTRLLANTDQTDAPVPRLLRTPHGDLVAAWAGGGYAVRTGKRWSRPRRIHEECDGDVALGAGGTAVYLRPVTRLDLSKLAGDFIHDRPLQGYAKPAVARRGAAGWRETRLLEARNFHRCAYPAVAGTHLVYFRELDEGPPELAYVDLAGDAKPEVVSRTRAFRFGREAALTVSRGAPLVAYPDESGLVIRRREKGAWSKPRVVLPGHPHNVCVAAHGELVHLVAITPGNFRILYVRVTPAQVAPPVRVATGGSCALTLEDGRPVVFWHETARRRIMTRSLPVPRPSGR
ncbi:MAG: hypothetical protein ACYTEZ_06520 [Planctomycetota bacterium]